MSSSSARNQILGVYCNVSNFNAVFCIQVGHSKNGQPVPTFIARKNAWTKKCFLKFGQENILNLIFIFVVFIIWLYSIFSSLFFANIRLQLKLRVSMDQGCETRDLKIWIRTIYPVRYIGGNLSLFFLSIITLIHSCVPLSLYFYLFIMPSLPPSLFQFCRVNI